MVKYVNWGKKYAIKKLKSLVGAKENAVYKGSNVLRNRERQRTGERQRKLFQTVQMVASHTVVFRGLVLFSGEEVIRVP